MLEEKWSDLKVILVRICLLVRRDFSAVTRERTAVHNNELLGTFNVSTPLALFEPLKTKEINLMSLLKGSSCGSLPTSLHLKGSRPVHLQC